MGRSYTPQYRIECDGGDCCPRVWNSRVMGGRPNPQRLERVLVDYANSANPGGVNEHISQALGRAARLPRSARVVNQFTGETVAEWVHPPFMVL